MKPLPIRAPHEPRGRRVLRGALLGPLVALLAGCAGPATGIGYYWQSATGHLALMQAARPVEDWLADTSTPDHLRRKLATARGIRAFAVSELGLPDNASYHRYADLRRRAAVYNVVAAPELSLTLQTWCFPVVGCVGYRGYYDETVARDFAATLAGGLEVSVYPVPAYSTLGWMNWAGGDPLLNTFIGQPDGELARLIFHELSHQVAYAEGDTVFNESYATAVERLGGARWLAERASAEAREQYQRFDQRRRELRALTQATRDRLDALYRGPGSQADKRAGKAAEMARLRAEHERLKREHWDGYTGFDAYIARSNNASLGVQAAYHAWVPAFEALFEREGRSFTRFHAAVQRLAAQPKTEREATLRALQP